VANIGRAATWGADEGPYRAASPPFWAGDKDRPPDAGPCSPAV